LHRVGDSWRSQYEGIHETFAALDLPSAVTSAPVTTREKAKTSSARLDEDPGPKNPPGKETLTRKLTEANAFLAAADKG